MEFMLEAGLLEWKRELFVIIVLISTIYWLITGIFNETTERQIHMKQRLYFLLGLSLFYICWGSPLYGIAHFMFSVHMLHMSLLYFLVTPLLLAGIPLHLYKVHKKFQFISKVWSKLTAPTISIVFFNGLFILYHIPIVMDTVMTTSWMYYGFHILLALASFCVWQPIVGSFLQNKLPYNKRKRYALVNTLVLLPACLLLFFSTIQYRIFTDYTAQSNMLEVCFGQNVDLNVLLGWKVLTPITDQRIGGAVMLILHKVSFLVGDRIQVQSPVIHNNKLETT
ncbi:cytochrome c oxidase assembly protein [Chengkuizengella axinellae]|uniref:Cytochrome c oxidase assembly protein n=1 Tax=Chengkuizengella axinellae TaxID=3064388 RepID=A0ABT9J2E6_9BACL|nr:cytochrome c oxidase assembly protein [Chengkuizengella sp. 2205SS18-9]MDP5275597.1 cytochrome c oxidase assembly protein [Chengkuizengella sp. 2205SS18-9]